MYVQQVKLMTGAHHTDGEGSDRDDAGDDSQTTSTSSGTNASGWGGGDAARMVRILYFTAVVHGLKGLYAGVEFHLIGTSIKVQNVIIDTKCKRRMLTREQIEYE
jgi:hypothetical protein